MQQQKTDQLFSSLQHHKNPKKMHTRLSQRLWKAVPSVRTPASSIELTAQLLKTQTRQLSLHEYQSYSLLCDVRHLPFLIALTSSMAFLCRRAE